MRFKFNGEIIEPYSPEPVRNTIKDVDKGLYTLSTRNALKLSNYVKDLLKVELGDKVAYQKYDKHIFLYKTTSDDPLGYPLTKLGLNKSFSRLNHSQLWTELGGSDKHVNKYELGEALEDLDEKNKPTGRIAFPVVFIKKQAKQAKSIKPKK